MKKIPKSLKFILLGYLSILAFVTLYSHIRPGHPVKADEKLLHRIAR